LGRGDLVRNCVLAVSAAVWAFAGSFGGACAVHAQSLRYLDKTEILIAPDLVVTRTIHQETTPLVESAVRAAAQSQWVVHGNQTAEVIEAFTRKADGRLIMRLRPIALRVDSTLHVLRALLRDHPRDAGRDDRVDAARGPARRLPDWGPR
jgi:hypothetical protein